MGFFKGLIIGALRGIEILLEESSPFPHIEWPPRKKDIDAVSAYPKELVQPTTVLNDILVERIRQERLRREGRFTHTCASPGMSDENSYLVLGEEFGEVGRAILECHRGDAEAMDKHDKELRKELIQVAAVCAAWVERLDRDTITSS